MQKKEMSNLQKDLYFKTKSYLTTIFLNDNLNIKVKEDQNLAQIILRILNYFENYELLYSVENNKFIEFQKAYSSYNIYKQIVNDFSDDDNFVDEINGLKTYLKNTYSFDLEKEQNLANLDFVYDENNKTSFGFEDEDKINHQANSQQESQTQDENLFNQQNQNPFSFQGHTSDMFTNSQETILNTSAQIVFSRKIYNGEIYMFETKPKIIPILKYMTFALYLLFFIIIVASTIIFYQMGYDIWITVRTGISVIESRASALQSVPFLIIITAALTSLIGFRVFSKRGKIENNLYSVSILQWTIPVLILCVATFSEVFSDSLALDSASIEEKFNKIIEAHDTAYKSLETKNQLPQDILTAEQLAIKIKGLYEGYVGLQITKLTVSIALIVVLITMFFFRPKYDRKRMESLLQSIKQDIADGKINPDTYDRSSSRSWFF